MLLSLREGPGGRRDGRYLVLRNEGLDLLDILGLLVPLDQHGLRPLDPRQQFFQQLRVGHEFQERRFKPLLVLLRPGENLEEKQAKKKD